MATPPTKLLSAVILAGGLGTRLLSVVSDRPKILAPVCGKPFIHYLLDQLLGFGFDSVLLLTGYRSEIVQAQLGNQYQSLSLRYSTESKPLGTGGAVRLALDLIQSPQVLLLNGDSYCQIDFNGFLQFHGRHPSCCSMALAVTTEGAPRYGSVLQDPSGRVTAFQEKSDQGAGCINAGIYLIPRASLQEIEQGSVVSLEKDLFPSWVHSPGIMGFSKTGRFIDIGIPQSFAEAQQFFAQF